MNIFHLKYFFDAARLQSISAAAEVNFVTHSAISQAIKNLETTLDTALVAHAKRKFQLTHQGELCFKEAQKFLPEFEAFKERIRATSPEPVGELSIWAPQSLITESFYKTILEYRKLYPKVYLKVATGAAQQAKTSILGERAQLGLLIDDENVGAFHTVCIRNGVFLPVAIPKLKNPKDECFLVTSADKIEVRTLAKAFQKEFKKPMKINMEVVSWTAIRALVLKGTGVGYVPDYCVQDELISGKLKEIKFPGAQFKYKLKAIWSKEKPLHPNAQLMLTLMLPTMKTL